jgi:hypothetical protein
MHVGGLLLFEKPEGHAGVVREIVEASIPRCITPSSMASPALAG